MRAFIVLFLSAMLLSTTYAQSQTNNVVDANINEVIAQYSTSSDFTGLGPKDQIFVPPIFRYRFEVQVTGQIRKISERRKAAIEKWAISNSGPTFAEVFTHEVELVNHDERLWLPWQDSLVEHFNAELSQGGSMSVRALYIGAIKGEFLFLALGYQQQ